MRFFGPAVLVLAVLSAPATAAPPPAGLPGGPYHCYQTFSASDRDEPPIWNSSDRVDITFDADYSETDASYTPSTYRVDRGDDFFGYGTNHTGRWSWDGSRIVFLDGPLVAPEQGWSVDAQFFPGHRSMPNDTEAGRTFPLMIRSLTDNRYGHAAAPATVGHESEDEYQSTFWYCGDYGQDVRHVVRDVLPYVQRTARVPVRLPRWFPTPDNPGQGSLAPRVLVAKRGYYRVGVVPSCEGGPCGEDAIFSAKRAPASDLGHRRRVSLGHGVTGWVGNYGCAYNGDDPDWGPRYCGRIAIVWHQAGVNYCIEAVGNFTETDLVIAARQAAG